MPVAFEILGSTERDNREVHNGGTTHSSLCAAHREFDGVWAR